MEISDKLKGHTILLGKDPTDARLIVGLVVDGAVRWTPMAGTDGVPASVSRLVARTSMAHCKIEVDAQATCVVITNMKAANVTYVDGTEIMAKRVKDNCDIALGKDRFTVSLERVLATAVMIADRIKPAAPREVSIKHLEEVWDTYEQKLDAIAERQRRMAAQQMFPPILTLGGGALSGGLATLGYMTGVYITAPLAICGVTLMIRNYVMRSRDKSREESKDNENWLFDNYVCPNSACQHFMGKQPYKILRQSRKCPYCGVAFTCN